MNSNEFPLTSAEITRRLEKLAVGMGALLFIACLPLPAYTLEATCGTTTIRSYEVLLSGAFGPFIGVWEWYANPLLFLSWIFVIKKYYAHAVAIAGLSVLTAFAFLFRDSMMSNEAGDLSRIASLGSGYWVWTMSIQGTLLVAAHLLIINWSRKPSDTDDHEREPPAF